ncbi:MAG TPA: FGGY-family carbohydrate kinase [Kiritimatiellia bacterium]|nr:FGGY-family carbohydrate kinase [Kiritimatiellia bacterium]HPS08998.1 FGGY-family carbohydrate kinase [Kiritimatiellia bacterium]
MARYLLGVDNGGTMSKAAVFTEDGRELSASGRKVEILEPHPGWSERDMDAMWRGTAEAIREAVAASGVDAAEIVCVACAGHGNGLYLIDADGHPVRNGINSMDSRAEGIIAQWRAEGVDARALPKTAQCIWPAQPNALLAWLRDHEPESVTRASAVLMAKDFIRFMLTGEAKMELTDMSGTSLMNVVTGRYDDAVLALFGIPEMKRLLPPLVKTADLCGAVTAAAAAATGLKAGTPVAGGMFDIDACGLASGCVDERQFVMVAGTWGNNQYIARQPLVDKGLFMTSCYSMPGWYLMLEGSPTGAGNLEWFIGEFLGDKKELLRREGQGSVYAWSDAAVAAKVPRENDPLFLPFLYGSNVGYPAKACFLGLESRHTREDVLRSVYEGCIFSHNTHLQRLYAFRSKPDVIRLTGGAARSTVWSQMSADIFQVPVEIPDGTELGALGAAVAAAVASGIYPSFETAVASMTRVARRHEPDAARRDIYALRYAKYLKAVSALREYF